jgi:predicted DNA-binding protein (MmcQ/YjbR family)
MTCRSGAPTQDGGKSSSIRIANSSTGTTTRSLTLEEVKTKKDNKLEFGAITEVDTNNGKLFILIKQRAHKPRVSLKTSDSISIDHSTSFQIFHSEE